MIIRFWGVRGSLPAPLLPAEVKAKVAAILEHAVPEDLANAESRERFLNELPPWLYGTVGGNTPCVSVDIDGLNEPVVFDCGSGIRELGLAYSGKAPAPARYHIFFSHFHWDHLIGFPFFGPAYNPAVSVDFYATRYGFETVPQGIMTEPYFPVRMESMSSRKTFNLLEAPIALGPASISFKKMSHPGDSFSYKISSNGKHFIYATDAELSSPDFVQTEENAAFFKDADMIVLDAQYTLEEAISKRHWGHNAFSTAVDFAANWGIKHLVLFHFDPAYDDRKLYGILQSARRYLDTIDNKGMEISLATEGLAIPL